MDKEGQRKLFVGAVVFGVKKRERMSVANLCHFAGKIVDFNKIVKESAALVVVDFFADWCGPCQSLGKQLPGIAKEYPNVKFLKVDVDGDSPLAEKYKVMSIPHVQFFKGLDGAEPQTVATVVGANTSAIRTNIEKYK
jgi:thioredoxin 1